MTNSRQMANAVSTPRAGAPTRPLSSGTNGAAQPGRTGSGGSIRQGSTLSSVRFLTVAEVARLMRVSKMTVYRLVHAGELQAVRVGRSFRVPESAVHTYLHDAFNE